MGKQAEGSLQERIQKLIERNGGYCFKNHGDMTTEPGRPDIVCCYKGLFMAIEAKVDNNTPTRQQGIHCRNVWKASGVAMIAWDTMTVEVLLNFISKCTEQNYSISETLHTIREYMKIDNIDDGTRW